MNNRTTVSYKGQTATIAKFQGNTQRNNGCIPSLLNCIHVSLTCVFSLRLSPSHCGCKERGNEEICYHLS